MVLLNGPVQNAWFCLMDRYRNVCVWFMPRNCRFPKVGTLCCQRGNHRLPLQGTAGSQRMELLVPNLGTRGYHCKQLPVPRGWNSRFPTWEPEVTIARNFRFPEVGTHASQPGNHGLPLQATVKMIWKHFRYNLMVLLNGPVQNAWFCLMDRYQNVCVWFMARNCRFPKVGTLCCQRGNHRLPLQGTAGSQRMELLVPNLGTRGYHCKQLPVAEVGTHASQPGKHRLPLQGTSGSQRLELLVPNLGTMGYHCKQLLKWYENIFVTTSWFCLMDRYRTLFLLTGPVPECLRLVHGKELPVPKGWNSLLPMWEPQVTIVRNCRFPEDGTLGSQPGNQRLPLRATAGSQRLELTLPNLGTTGRNCRSQEAGTLGSQPGNHGLPLQATVKS